MRTALAVQAATFRRSLTARIVSVFLLVLPTLFAVGLVSLARSGAIAGPSAAKFEPYTAGTFAEASVALAGQVLSALSIIGVGFAVVWLVGREWADHTIGSLFALPVSRRSLATAKLLVVGGWACAFLTASIVILGAAIAVVGGASFDANTVSDLVRLWLAALLTAAVALPFAWVAVVGRGFLGAVGVIIAVTAVSQILASLGVGAWIPYIAPALWAGAGGAEAQAEITMASLAVAIAFAMAGGWATVRAFSRSHLD